MKRKIVEKGSLGSRLRRPLLAGADVVKSSARERVPARIRQPLASTPFYYSGAMLGSLEPKCPLQKQKSPL